MLDLSPSARPANGGARSAGLGHVAPTAAYTPLLDQVPGTLGREPWSPAQRAAGAEQAR